MQVSRIAIVLTIAALVSSPVLAAAGGPTNGANPTGNGNLVAGSSRTACVKSAADLSITSPTLFVRCANSVASTNRSPCINPVTGLLTSALNSGLRSDTKARKADLRLRRAYLKARGARLAGVAQTACDNPANGVKIAQLSPSARAGVATAGGSNFLGAGLIPGLLGITAGTAGGVAALTNNGNGSSPASP